jgi:hypothetical protein
MEQCDLDLRFSVFEGTTASIGRVILFGHLRAQTKAAPPPTPQLLLMCRDDSGCPPPWITRSPVTDQDVLRLARLLRAAGFPARGPAIAPNPGPLGLAQHLSLVVGISGRRRSLNLVLEHAGFSGADAEPFRAVLNRLGELAEAAGRPTVRALLDDLVVDRRCGGGPARPRDGLPLRDRIWTRACPADGPAGLALLSAPGDADRRPTPPTQGVLTNP